MKMLAIDTSTEACSAALMHDGDIIEQYQIAPQQHSELILKMVDGLMQQAGFALTALDAIAFGRGPGSFVGVRIATGVVQGLAYAAQLPVIPISSLAAMAQGYPSDTHFSSGDKEYLLVAIDARMQEVYWAEYKRNRSGLVDLIGAEMVQVPERVSKESGDMPSAIYYGIGTGWGSYHDVLAGQFKPKEINSQVFPHAKDVLVLALREYENGNLIVASEARPVYLRNQVVKKPTGPTKKLKIE